MELLRLNIQMFADGKVVIDTDLNKKGFESGLSKMQSIAKTGFKAVGTAVGVASTAVAGLVGKAVTMAGELEQNVGGAEAVFGNLGDTISDMTTTIQEYDKATGEIIQKTASLEEVSTEAYKNMGVSQSDYLSNLNKMGSLMQGSGIDQQKALDLSSQAMQRAADVASIMGIDVNSAMESIAGAAKGNFTMMDNLGVAMNATTIEAYALSKGIDQSYNEMDNATKVGLAMEMFLEKTSYAAGNYAKENETFAGSFQTLKAATSNFLSGSGGIEEVADALISFGGILVESITQMAPTIVEGLVSLTETLLPQIPILLEALMPAVLEGAIALINGLVAIFPALITIIQQNLPTIVQGAITIVQTLLTTILTMLPQILEMGITVLLELVQGIIEAIPELIPAIIQCIDTMLSTLISFLPDLIIAGLDLLMALVFGIVDNINEIIDATLYLIGELIATLLRPDMLTKIIMAAIELVMALIIGLMKAIPDLVLAIPKIIAAIVDTFRNMDWGKIGKDILNGIINGFLDIGNLIWNAVKKVGNSMLGAIQKFFGIASPSKLMRDKVGRYLTQGIGVGFEDELDTVYNDMQRALDFETDKMSANVQASGTYQMAMTGMPTFNLLDNSEHSTQLVVNGKVLAEVVNTENRNREVAAS